MVPSITYWRFWCHRSLLYLPSMNIDQLPSHHTGEIGVGPSHTSGDHLSGPTAVCLLPWGWCWGCHHPSASASTLSPGPSWQRMRIAFFDFSSAFTQSSLHCSEGNGNRCRCRHLNNLLNYRLPEGPSSTEGMSVWAAGQKKRSTKWDCILTSPLHVV